MKATLTGQRLMALFLLGAVLFNYPLLSIFDLPRVWAGIPLLYLYVFGLWLLLVILMIWIIER
ncbi:MAG: hypothetical protein PHD22_07500 [Zoogloea sp.]|nr:hypothetical protein [Zoogloea sp.]MDD3353478.1 hypothetical protein [Zoogloea sp.]